MDGTTTHLYFPHFDEENPGKTHSQTNHNKKSPETHAKLPKATPKTAKRRRKRKMRKKKKKKKRWSRKMKESR